LTKKIIDLKIPEVKLIMPEIYNDRRGSFEVFFNLKDYEELSELDQTDFVQDNISYSNRNVIRGLHYQHRPNDQAKIITCVKGRIFDVAVDLRPFSKTYKKFVTQILDEDNRYSIYIPQGFAHGFMALDKENIVLYKVTKYRNPEDEITIKYNCLNIPWPKADRYILSNKDEGGTNIDEFRYRMSEDES
jgi:dTDP-4-dehydrorhamnose 3,5-epimerase